MASPAAPAESAGAEAVVTEAMRDDTDLPLFVACAGGLTTVASAWLLEPRISERLTVVWLGGHAYGTTDDELSADVHYRETNVMTDLVACQVVFNHSDLPMWQISQDATRPRAADSLHAQLRTAGHRAATADGLPSRAAG